MATPCNGAIECIDGSDERRCEIADWYLYSILLLAAFVLGITSFVSLQKHVRKEVNEIMQDRRWRRATENWNRQMVVIASEKLMKIAFHAGNGNKDEVIKLLQAEMRVHINKPGVICCLKVSNFRQRIKIGLVPPEHTSYVMHIFQNHLDYETFLKVVEMQRGQPYLKLIIEKMKFLLCSNSIKKDSNEDLYVHFFTHM